MWILKWLGIAALLIVLLGFSMLNIDQKVNIDLLFWQFQDVSLILVIFEAFIFGMLVWFLLALVNELKLRTDLRNAIRSREELRRELQALRNMPLEETVEEEELTASDDDD